MSAAIVCGSALLASSRQAAAALQKRRPSAVAQRNGSTRMVVAAAAADTSEASCWLALPSADENEAKSGLGRPRVLWAPHSWAACCSGRRRCCRRHCCRCRALLPCPAAGPRLRLVVHPVQPGMLLHAQTLPPCLPASMQEVTIRRRPPHGIEAQNCGPVDFKVPLQGAPCSCCHHWPAAADACWAQPPVLIP